MKRTITTLGAMLLATAIFLAQSPPPGTPHPASPPPTFRIAPPPHLEPEKNLEFPLGESVGRGGHLFISIKIGEKEHLFVVDTGGPASIIDSTLAQSLQGLLGTPIGKSNGSDGHGEKKTFPIYHPPPLEAGGRRLKNGGKWIITMDLESMRQTEGQPIEGLLGMDVLSQYVVRLDFHRHMLELIDPDNFQAPRDQATKMFPMIYTGPYPGFMLPYVGLPEMLVEIDTGDNSVGTITRETLQKIPAAEFVETTRRFVADPSGNSDFKVVQIKRKWSIGKTSFENVPLEIDSGNRLGLNALADFIVTLDFPQQQVYLESIQTQHPPESPFLEFNILLKNGNFIVDNLTDKAKSLDIQVNDQLLTVDGKDISKTDLWLLREQLKKAPAPVLRLKRGDQTHEVILHHDRPPATTAP